MSFNPSTDFLGLLRRTSGGVRAVRMPGLDYVIAAMVRAGIFSVSTGQVAPVINQSTTVWFKPDPAGSWSAEGAVFLYNLATLEYEPANPVLWSSLLLASAIPPAQVQEVTTPGPVDVLVGAGVVQVNQVISAPITLVMPPSLAKVGPVLISDWKGDAGANNILVALSGTDKFPGNRTDWTVAADAGSIYLRPIPGGYAL